MCVDDVHPRTPPGTVEDDRETRKPLDALEMSRPKSGELWWVNSRPGFLPSWCAPGVVIGRHEEFHHDDCDTYSVVVDGDVMIIDDWQLIERIEK